MKSVVQLYKNAFGGLSTPAWMLALIMLINRSGSMVLPFMSIYLTSHLGFSIADSGIILSLFGVGSMIGSYIGGWASDKFGHFYIQLFALVVGGSLFFVLVNLTDFYQLCVGILILSIVVECFRPANSAAVAHYAKPENITRAYSLNRMAINLGFSIGPAIGGFLAAASYSLLFYADGITCIIAGFVFYLYFNRLTGNKKNVETDTREETLTSNQSPYRDIKFIAFLVLCYLYALVFFQFFSTLPIYYREVYALTESNIGGILALNGIVVFSLEMLIVYWIGNRVAGWKLIAFGMFINGISFLFLLDKGPQWILYLQMTLLSLSEIFAMPYMVTYTVKLSNSKNRGAYMGMYSLAYSLAHITSPYLGTKVISIWGFDSLWTISTVIGLISCILTWIILAPKKKLKHRLSTN